MDEPRRRQIGPYRLDVLLGRGGMGEIYKAWDERLERWVAVKHLLVGGDADGVSPPRSPPEEGVRARFRREAKTAAGLGHPAILQVFDVLEDDGDDWIVMELVDGPDLAELLRDGPLDVGLVLDYGRQITSGLAAAHGAGVVHRDLKTENVMVHPSGHTSAGRTSAGHTSAGHTSAGHTSAGHTSAGHIKILDFGLAKGTPRGDENDTMLSAPGRIAGTPRAMSPEQVRGYSLDARSDLFSFGVLLYELLTARSPFSARSLHETLARILTHRQPPARSFDSRIPPELSELVDHLLEKDRDHRPGSAGEVAEALERIAAGSPAVRRAPDSLLDTQTLVRTWEGEAVIRTLLVSDLVGSTKLVKELGDRDAAALFRRHDRLARDLLAAHGGLEIEKTDASPAAIERKHSLLLFERPWKAVGYALAYHDALRELSLSPPLGPLQGSLPLASRVGIHLGEVILLRNPPDDIARGAKPVEVEGIAEPTAARLMSLALGGQTLLTRVAFEVARCSATDEAAEDLEWLCHGGYRFKGIEGDVEVFEVGVPTVAPLVAPEGSEKAWRADLRPSAAPHPSPLPEGEGVRTEPAVVLRTWPPPDLPEQPYPVLLPYTHPELMAGREQEIEEIRMQLRLPVPIFGLGAPSGTGKSSFLLGGLVPGLRADGHPVAVVRHPQEAGVARRLLGDLLDGIEDDVVPLGGMRGGDSVDDDWRGFVLRLGEVERLAGEAPLLVLDQFENVLRAPSIPQGDGRARARLGILLAATAQRRPGIDEPLCRWLLAYRQEFHGEVLAWLDDVLLEATATAGTGSPAAGSPAAGSAAAGSPAAGSPAADALRLLPHDLSGPERFQSLTLTPFATPPPAGDPLAEAQQVFQAAIEKPLRLHSVEGTSPWGDRGGASTSPRGNRGGTQQPCYDLRFAPGHAERLARAFAEARLARPEESLVPELQVVLAHLVARADADGLITVPGDPGDVVEEALADHLRHALEAAFPETVPLGGSRGGDSVLSGGMRGGDTADVRTRRAKALLALRELASAAGRRDEGLPAEDLARAIGDDGESILEQLATPLTRLVVLWDSPEGLRYVLSHDRMAEVVVRMVEEEGRHGKLLVDAELLALRRFVALKTALHTSSPGGDRGGKTQAHAAEAVAPKARHVTIIATRIPRRHYRGVATHAGALLWDDERRAWWAACKKRHRADLARSAGLAVTALVFLALVTWGTWSWVEQRSQYQALLDQVVEAEPGVALQTFDQLTKKTSAEELLTLLRRRERTMDVLEQGLGEIPEEERSAVVLRTVAIALPWVDETPDDPVLIANLVWALDYGPGRDPAYAAQAEALRDRVLEPLRNLRPAPEITDGDPDWVPVPAGTFQMGSPDGEGQGDEHPRHEVTVSAFRIQRHEVTNAEYRLLVPAVRRSGDPGAGSPDGGHEADDNLPAAYLSWYEAYTYAAWLGGRLPTEAEWEYAARAGCPYAYCTRDGLVATVGDVAWTLGNSTDPETGAVAPSPVMRLEPNPWGLYDMLGNRWEWTTDWYTEYEAVQLPAGPQGDPWGLAATSGGQRVIRGGCFRDLAGRSRVAYRFRLAPGLEFVYLGCRVVLPRGPEL